MKLVCLSLALICIQGTSAALNMIRRDPWVTIADEGTARYDWHPPTTTMDLRERTSIHWDDHHDHRDWEDDHWNDIVHVSETVRTTPIPHWDTTTHWWGNTHDDIVHSTEFVHHWDDHHTVQTTLIPHLDTTTHWWGNTHDDIVLVTESAHGPGASVAAPKPDEIDYKCKFSSGNGNGGTQVKIGEQKARPCIKACIARKKKDPSINGITVFENGKKGGCWCEKKMTGVKKSGVYRTCFLKPIVKPQEPSVPEPVPNKKTYTCHPWSKHDEQVMEETGLHWANYCAELGNKWNGGNYDWTPGCGKCMCCKPNVDNQPPGPVTSPRDYPYEKYKNKQCQDVNWYAKGCYRTKHAFKRGKLLVYWRHDIEWAKDRIGSFASSLACACAEAARANGVKFFGLHYWGECWALDMEDVLGDPEGDCILADGKYETKCAGHFNKHWNPGCLAINSYMLHVVFSSEDRPDFPIKMKK